MNFLNKAHEKYQEYAPKLMEVHQEVQEQKMEYMRLSDKELVKELKQSSGKKRMAIVMLLNERGIKQDSDGVWRRQ